MLLNNLFSILHTHEKYNNFKGVEEECFFFFLSVESYRSLRTDATVSLDRYSLLGLWAVYYQSATVMVYRVTSHGGRYPLDGESRRGASRAPWRALLPLSCSRARSFFFLPSSLLVFLLVLLARNNGRL